MVNWSSSSLTQKKSLELKPPHLNIESYQLDQVPPMRVALKMICTPGHSRSPPCIFFRYTPRSITCSRERMPIA